jgi:sugar lactone lactonase YvrE
MRRATAELFLDIPAIHGEGPAWDAASRRLLWLDMQGQRIHRTTEDGVDEEVAYERPTASVAPRSGGGYAVALNDGVFLEDPAGTLEPIFLVPDASIAHLNDGKCDPWGRFWIGSMAWDAVSPLGSLYRVDSDHTVTTVLTGVTISNGMAWTADRRTMYYIDTGAQRVDAFDMDDGAIRPESRRAAVVIGAGPGRPDGMALDDEGCLWVALWCGGAVHRYTPDGTLDTILSLPVSQVTSCAFGGSDGGVLFITTSTLGAPADAMSTGPAGALYRWRPGVSGRPANMFDG